MTACGLRPTVTDSDLLATATDPGGRYAWAPIKLNRSRSYFAVDRISAPLDLDPVDVARLIRRDFY